MKTEIKLPPEFVIALVKDWARQKFPECLGGIADVSIKAEYGRFDRVEIEFDTKLQRMMVTEIEETAPTPVPVPYYEPPEEPTPEPVNLAATIPLTPPRKSPFNDDPF